MGCKIAKASVSPDQEESTCSESSTLLENGHANGNGYGIERLTDDPPSPVEDERTQSYQWPTEATPVLDRGAGAAYPIQTDAPPHVQKPRRDVRTEELRSSAGSSHSSERSLSRSHTEPHALRPPRHVAVREKGREWGGLNGQPPHVQPPSNNLNARGLARPQPYLEQLNKQNALKLGGPVEADGVIRLPQPSTPVVYGQDSTKSQKGKEVMEELSKAYRWREQFERPSQDFLALMDRLYMDCQLHLTALSSRGDVESRREADAIVSEMVALRNYWGPQLLPSSTCNAFVRERILLTLGVEQRQFRIDCAQFFEPVPFYNNQQSNCPGELMKLYRFSVYNVDKNEVVLRYYLERSNVIQLYHVLCFTCENYRGQVKPYGSEPPSYWEVRQNMLEDVYSRLLSGLTPANHHHHPKPQTSTIYPANTMAANTMGTLAHIHNMPVASNT